LVKPFLGPANMAVLFRKIFNLKNKEKGFSLTELLVVLGNLAILLIDWYVSRLGQVAKARDAKRKSDLNKIQIVLEDYLDNNLRYPEELVCGSATGTPLEDYLREIPCDPLNRGDYVYQYQTDETGEWYKIYTFLETESDPDIEKVGCEEGCGPGKDFNYFVSSPNVVVCKDPYLPAECGGKCYPETPCICCYGTHYCLPQGDCCRPRTEEDYCP